MMRVLHSGSLYSVLGGPSMSTYLTLKGLRSFDVDAEIMMYSFPELGQLRGEDVPVHFAHRPWDKKILFSNTLKKEMLSLGKYDIYHAQGIWQWQTYALVDAAKTVQKPYIITPRGMLYPQDIAKASTTFKKLSLKWRLLKDLNNAACVHVTCKDEMLHCRNLGVTSPIGIIPNPVEIRDYNEKKKDDVFRIGYLGRLSRRKNVEGLIRAFIELGDKVKDAELLIIGGGDESYETELKRLVADSGLKNVVFAGFLNGKAKDVALASCSVLAMPSEFENLGNVILEGLVRRIPCIATTGSPWEELNTEHCGWWVPYTQEDITDAVEKALNTSKEELAMMGENGRKLIERRYSVEAVAKEMKILYEWIMGGEKPEFVFE